MISMKCDCYFEQEIIDPFLYDRRLVGRCNGTKNRGICKCRGNISKCDFYPEKRKSIQEKKLKNRDKKELEFYRWWVTKHNLNVEVATAFEKWLKENK